MIVATSETMPGKRIKRVVGLVRGNTVRTRHIGRDLTAAFKNITGGEIREYTKLMAEAREQCLDRMREEAAKLGADAVVGVRFMTTGVMANAAELLVYGTAVIFEEE
ncbi:MAG: YbjQ family protein [Candidatus Krumholzibacteria bacterium]|nr:YbjQ family protein [Candidatus Krumholzibacteria bacterium]